MIQTNKFAKRLEDIEPFRVMAILDQARSMEAAGQDIIHLEIGEPDFNTPTAIIEAGQRALGDGLTHYTQALGLPALREAIAQFYADEYQLTINPRRIVITPGASGALLLLSALLVNPGESLLMTDPGYPCNRHFLRLFDGQAQAIAVDTDSHFQLTAAQVSSNWQTNTVGVLAASPANPTGELLNLEQLKSLHAICQRRGGHLIVDEIYQGLCYGQQAPTALAVSDEVYVINSFSKYFGMTGWRLGWLVAPEAAVDELDKLAQNLFIASSTPAQHAALAAFEPDTREELNRRRDIFAQRRDFLLPALREIGFRVPHTPAGAFYIYAGIPSSAENSSKLCQRLLAEQHIAITPGCDFGRHRAEEFVRFSYTTPMARLEAAVEKLARLF